MKLTQQLLDELEREAPRTKGVLQNIPAGKDDWKPHPKSMALLRLAGLVASMPSWISLIIDQDELNLTPTPGSGAFQPPTHAELLDALDKAVVKGRESLSKTTDDYLLTTKWALRAQGHVVMSQLRHIVLTETFNHLAHHRGQLTVYLRLLDAPVPSVYGPTADDQRFG